MDGAVNESDVGPARGGGSDARDKQLLETDFQYTADTFSEAPTTLVNATPNPLHRHRRPCAAISGGA